MTTCLYLPDPQYVYMVAVLQAHFLRGLIARKGGFDPALALHFAVEIVGSPQQGRQFHFGVTTHGTRNHTARYKMALNALETPYAPPGCLDTDQLTGKRFYVRISHAYDSQIGLYVRVDEMYPPAFQSGQ